MSGHRMRSSARQVQRPDYRLRYLHEHESVLPTLVGARHIDWLREPKKVDANQFADYRHARRGAEGGRRLRDGIILPLSWGLLRLRS